MSRRNCLARRRQGASSPSAGGKHSFSARGEVKPKWGDGLGEGEAARLLGLEPAAVRQSGYDAIRRRRKEVDRLQIKGRCILSSNPGQRLGRIDLIKKWDAVVLVLLDANLEPTSIYEAGRAEIERVLSAPGSKARNERGALSVSKFKSIGSKVWPTGKSARQE